MGWKEGMGATNWVRMQKFIHLILMVADRPTDTTDDRSVSCGRDEKSFPLGVDRSIRIEIYSFANISIPHSPIIQLVID